jgi:hypothetical protein
VKHKKQQQWQHNSAIARQTIASSLGSEERSLSLSRLDCQSASKTKGAIVLDSFDDILLTNIKI